MLLALLGYVLKKVLESGALTNLVFLMSRLPANGVRKPKMNVIAMPYFFFIILAYANKYQIRV